MDSKTNGQDTASAPAYDPSAADDVNAHTDRMFVESYAATFMNAILSASSAEGSVLDQYRGRGVSRAAFDPQPSPEDRATCVAKRLENAAEVAVLAAKILRKRLNRELPHRAERPSEGQG